MKFYVSKMRTMGLLLLGIALVAMCAFCTTIDKITAKIVGWIGVIFFGLGLPLGLRELFREKEQLVIDENGLSGRRVGGILAWSEIEGVWIGSINSTKLLCVDLKSPEKYLSTLSKTKRALANTNVSMGFAPLAIGFQGLIPGLDEAWRYLQLNHADKILKKELSLNTSIH